MRIRQCTSLSDLCRFLPSSSTSHLTPISFASQRQFQWRNVSISTPSRDNFHDILAEAESVQDGILSRGSSTPSPSNPTSMFPDQLSSFKQQVSLFLDDVRAEESSLLNASLHRSTSSSSLPLPPSQSSLSNPKRSFSTSSNSHVHGAPPASTAHLRAMMTHALKRQDRIQCAALYEAHADPILTTKTQFFPSTSSSPMPQNTKGVSPDLASLCMYLDSLRALRQFDRMLEYFSTTVMSRLDAIRQKAHVVAKNDHGKAEFQLSLAISYAVVASLESHKPLTAIPLLRWMRDVGPHSADKIKHLQKHLDQRIRGIREYRNEARPGAGGEEDQVLTLNFTEDIKAQILNAAFGTKSESKTAFESVEKRAAATAEGKKNMNMEGEKKKEAKPRSLSDSAKQEAEQEQRTPKSRVHDMNTIRSPGECVKAIARLSYANARKEALSLWEHGFGKVFPLPTSTREEKIGRFPCTQEAVHLVMNLAVDLQRPEIICAIWKRFIGVEEEDKNVPYHPEQQLPLDNTGPVLGFVAIACLSRPSHPTYGLQQGVSALQVMWDHQLPLNSFIRRKLLDTLEELGTSDDQDIKKRVLSLRSLVFHLPKVEKNGHQNPAIAAAPAAEDSHSIPNILVESEQDVRNEEELEEVLEDVLQKQKSQEKETTAAKPVQLFDEVNLDALQDMYAAGQFGSLREHFAQMLTWRVAPSCREFELACLACIKLGDIRTLLLYLKAMSARNLLSQMSSSASDTILHWLRDRLNDPRAAQALILICPQGDSLAEEAKAFASHLQVLAKIGGASVFIQEASSFLQPIALAEGESSKSRMPYGTAFQWTELFSIIKKWCEASSRVRDNTVRHSLSSLLMLAYTRALERFSSSATVSSAVDMSPSAAASAASAIPINVLSMALGAALGLPSRKATELFFNPLLISLNDLSSQNSSQRLINPHFSIPRLHYNTLHYIMRAFGLLEKRHDAWRAFDSIIEAGAPVSPLSLRHLAACCRQRTDCDRILQEHEKIGIPPTADIFEMLIERCISAAHDLTSAHFFLQKMHDRGFDMCMLGDRIFTLLLQSHQRPDASKPSAGSDSDAMLQIIHWLLERQLITLTPSKCAQLVHGMRGQASQVIEMLSAAEARGLPVRLPEHRFSHLTTSSSPSFSSADDASASTPSSSPYPEVGSLILESLQSELPKWNQIALESARQILLSSTKSHSLHATHLGILPHLIRAGQVPFEALPAFINLLVSEASADRPSTVGAATLDDCNEVLRLFVERSSVDARCAPSVLALINLMNGSSTAEADSLILPVLPAPNEESYEAALFMYMQQEDFSSARQILAFLSTQGLPMGDYAASVQLYLMIRENAIGRAVGFAKRYASENGLGSACISVLQDLKNTKSLTDFAVKKSLEDLLK